jgi:hypothetical protein
VVPHVHLREQFGNRDVLPVPLDVEVHQPRVLAVQLEDFDQCGDAALFAERVRLAPAEPLEFGPGVFARRGWCGCRTRCRRRRGGTWRGTLRACSPGRVPTRRGGR